jgi:hypothetical protein
MPATGPEIHVQTADGVANHALRDLQGTLVDAGLDVDERRGGQTPQRTRSVGDSKLSAHQLPIEVQVEAPAERDRVSRLTSRVLSAATRIVRGTIEAPVRASERDAWGSIEAEKDPEPSVVAVVVPRAAERPPSGCPPLVAETWPVIVIGVGAGGITGGGVGAVGALPQAEASSPIRIAV